MQTGSDSQSAVIDNPELTGGSLTRRRPEASTPMESAYLKPASRRSLMNRSASGGTPG